MNQGPETAASPLAQAPPDRGTINLEEWARQGLALLLGDRVIDENEMQVLRSFFQQVAMHIQGGGQIGAGQGMVPQEGDAPTPAAPPWASESDDYGSGQGEPMEQDQ